jgi:hypothetical protein
MDVASGCNFSFINGHLLALLSVFSSLSFSVVSWSGTTIEGFFNWNGNIIFFSLPALILRMDSFVVQEPPHIERYFTLTVPCSFIESV